MLALTLVLLTGCAGFGSNDKPDKLGKQPLPADLKTCFKYQSNPPPAGALGANEAAKIIGGMRQREVKYIRCGNRLIAIYEAT